MRYLKQSTAVTVPIGPFYDATDGVTIETALTISPSSVYLSKNNGVLATKDNTATATYDAAGIYRIDLGGTVDTATAGNLRIVANISGAVGVFEDFVVLPGQVYDSLVSGTDLLDVSEAQIGGVTTTVGAGGTISLGANGARVEISEGTLGSATLKADGVTRIQAGLATSTAVQAIEDQLTGTIALGAGGTLAIGATGATVVNTGTVVVDTFTANAMGILRTGIGLSAANLDTQLSTIDTVVDAVKVQTDKLTFTVANQIDANIQYVNDVLVNGTGTGGDPWGP